MLNVQFRQAITETLDIIEHMEKEYRDKIPIQFMSFLKENMIETYKPMLDHSKQIYEMELKKDTKNILAIIYYKFWCDNTAKTNFMRKVKANEKKYKQDLREKYNPDKVFEKHFKEDIKFVDEYQEERKIKSKLDKKKIQIADLSSSQKQKMIDFYKKEIKQKEEKLNNIKQRILKLKQA